MASTNKTANLKLNQWVLTDPFNMSDFNADNLKIDNVISNVPIKRLVDISLNASVSTVEIDLSGIDISKYASLRIYQRNSIPYFYLRVNGYTSYLYWLNLNWQTDSSYCYDGGMGYFDIELAQIGMFIHTPYRLMKPGSNIQQSALSKINVICSPSDANMLFPIGSRFIVMGVLK